LYSHNYTTFITDGKEFGSVEPRKEEEEEEEEEGVLTVAAFLRKCGI